MFVFMAEDRLVALDGVTITKLDDGSTYEVPDDVGARLIERGYAVAGDAEDVEREDSVDSLASEDESGTVESKDLGAAEENKETVTDQPKAKPRRRRRQTASE